MLSKLQQGNLLCYLERNEFFQEDSHVEDLLSGMSDKHQRAFRHALETGALQLEPWIPWWKVALIQPLGDVKTLCGNT